jgi:CRP/FNR family cyclic AMP-dependent transcriptional regulator
LKELPNIQLFQVLNDGEKELLMRSASLRDISKFNYLYLEDSTTEKVYFLLEGMIKVSTRSDQGREAIKAILHQHEIFGEHGLTGQSVRDEFAVAMLDGAKVLEVDVDCLKSLMQKNHLYCLKIFKFLGDKLRIVEQRLEAQIFLNAKDRIIDFIRDSACKRGRRVGYDHLLKRSLTQQEIANYTGTSRQTVTEVFNELKKSNLIFFNRNKILIREGFNLACENRSISIEQTS